MRGSKKIAPQHFDLYNISMKKLLNHPALINSSYVIFFHIFTLLWALYFASYFPYTIRGLALIISLIYPVAFFWFLFLLRQFEDVNYVLRLVLGYFAVTALFAFLSAVLGPLSDGQLPVIRIFFFGPYIIAGSFMSALFASVLLFYGYVTYVSGIVSASVAEIMYTKLLSRAMPGQIKKLLQRADSSIDISAIRLSDRFFFMNQRLGFMTTIAIIAFLTVMFSILIIVR